MASTINPQRENLPIAMNSAVSEPSGSRFAKRKLLMMKRDRRLAASLV
jgi:hypothetical protein